VLGAGTIHPGFQTWWHRAGQKECLHGTSATHSLASHTVEKLLHPTRNRLSGIHPGNVPGHDRHQGLTDQWEMGTPQDDRINTTTNERGQDGLNPVPGNGSRLETVLCQSNQLGTSHTEDLAVRRIIINQPLQVGPVYSGRRRQQPDSMVSGHARGRLHRRNNADHRLPDPRPKLRKDHRARRVAGNHDNIAGVLRQGLVHKRNTALNHFLLGAVAVG